MTLPEGWEEIELGEVAKINMGQSPSSSDVNNQREGLPFFQGNADFGYINPIPNAWIKRPLKLAEAGEILFSVRAPVGELNIANEKSCIGRGICSILPVDADRDYIFYILQHNKPILQRLSQGSTFQAVNKGDLETLTFYAATLPEQKKISSILKSVDVAIEATQEIIDQTTRFKKSAMNNLLTHGLPGKHTRFQMTSLGEIPADWKFAPLGSIFNLVERRVQMTDDQEYQLVTVKRRNGGVVPRERLRGSQVKVKTQFEVREGDFLISKRQIVHGACEIVPKSLSGAIISNEYNVLHAKEDLYLPYFRWVTRSQFMYRYFMVSSVGVHIEKMLFKLDHWYKQKIPLPPFDEQKKITAMLESLEHSAAANQNRLNQLKALKTALMQALLTGKVRVPVETRLNKKKEVAYG